MLHIHQFPCLNDNYGFLVHEPQSRATVAIDTPDADEILRQAASKGWRVTDIWNTHWHPDHAGGNAALKAATGAKITGPVEVERIGAAPDRIVREGDLVQLGTEHARVLDVGGHTLGHVAYVFDAENIAFVGDALFALGCGRVFEGTAEQMWTSLSKLRALPENTILYCAHEYTQSNARFAVAVDVANEVLAERVRQIDRLRSEGKPTVPTTLGEERATNPFLRAPQLKAALGMSTALDWEAFAEMRRRKDEFRG